MVDTSLHHFSMQLQSPSPLSHSLTNTQAASDPNSAPLLDKQYNPSRGYHYIARQAIKAGTCILISTPIQSHPSRAPTHDDTQSTVPHIAIQQLALHVLQNPDTCQSLA